ncbi:MAG: hypothetical protein ACR2H5_26745 [Ktedonobacteraceae bacterium]
MDKSRGLQESVRVVAASPDQTQLGGSSSKATLGAKLGTLECAASPNLYGEGLNRITRVSASALHVKPLINLVEATITRATGGSERSEK